MAYNWDDLIKHLPKGGSSGSFNNNDNIVLHILAENWVGSDLASYMAGSIIGDFAFNTSWPGDIRTPYVQSGVSPVNGARTVAVDTYGIAGSTVISPPYLALFQDGHYYDGASFNGVPAATQVATDKWEFKGVGFAQALQLYATTTNQERYMEMYFSTDPLQAGNPRGYSGYPYYSSPSGQWMDSTFVGTSKASIDDALLGIIDDDFDPKDEAFDAAACRLCFRVTRSGTTHTVYIYVNGSLAWSYALSAGNLNAAQPYFITESNPAVGEDLKFAYYPTLTASSTTETITNAGPGNWYLVSTAGSKWVNWCKPNVAAGATNEFILRTWGGGMVADPAGLSSDSLWWTKFAKSYEVTS